MSNIIPFDSENLPSYLADDAKRINSDLAGHVGGGFPVISIKGKVFTIKRDGARTVIPNPKDPESAATAIEVVLVRINKHKSKVFYAKGWKEGDDGKPDCFSNDGIAPDASVEKPQNKNCATCKNNAWGSKVSESGTKLKACSDAIRVAVAAPDSPDDPMLLRIPAASMKGLGEFASFCQRKNVPYNSVVVRVGFDTEASTPKLSFKGVGFLPPESYKLAKRTAESETVEYIVNGVAGGYDAEPESPTEAEEVIERVSRKAAQDDTVYDEEIVTAVTKPKAKVAEPVESVEDEVEEEPKPKAKAKPKAETTPKVEDLDVDLDLSEIDFDD
jgi:hypothetical protein